MNTQNAALLEDHTSRFVNVAPDQYPTASIAQVPAGEQLKDWRMFWAELDVLPDTTQSATALAAPTVDGQIDTVNVASTLGARVGLIAMINRTGEQSVITDVTSATQIKIKRYTTAAQTGGAGAAIKVGDTIQWLDQPMDEGWKATPSGQVVLPHELQNVVETWVEPIKITGRQQAIYAQGGGQHGFNYNDMKAQAMERVKRAQNMRLLYGGQGTSDGTDGINTITGGMPGFAAYSDTTPTDYTVRANFENLVKNVCLNSGEKKLLMAMSSVTQMLINRLYQAGTPGYFGTGIIQEVGVDVERIRIFWGGVTIYCYYEPCLNDYVDPDNSNRQLGEARIWSPKWVKYRPLRKTGLYSLPRQGDLYEEIFMAEGGFQFDKRKTLQVIKGIIKPAA
jgi:hypothetical protein